LKPNNNVFNIISIVTYVPIVVSFLQWKSRTKYLTENYKIIHQIYSIEATGLLVEMSIENVDNGGFPE